MPSKRGRVEGFAWRDETTVAREQNVTSGAAAVLVRREHHQQASPITANRGRGREKSDGDRSKKRKHMR